MTLHVSAAPIAPGDRVFLAPLKPNQAPNIRDADAKKERGLPFGAAGVVTAWVDRAWNAEVLFDGEERPRAIRKGRLRPVQR
jgi:hypothetical protein